VNAAGQLLEGLLFCSIALLWIRFVADWVQVFARTWRPSGVVLVLLEAVFSVTDPPIKAVRRVLPPLRIAGAALDLSWLVVLVAVYALRAAVSAIFL
jgi:YggT family protein